MAGLNSRIDNAQERIFEGKSEESSRMKHRDKKLGWRLKNIEEEV